MKHIAVLSNSYYPIMGAPSAVIDKYIKEMEFNYSFHIVTKTSAYDVSPSLEYDLYYITNFRHNLYKRCLYYINKHHYVVFYKILLILLRIYAVIQTHFLFPSSNRWEINAYYNKLKEIYNIYKFNTIIAVSDYYVTQMAALKFKKKNPQVKWILFATDPYSENYVYYKHKLFKNIWKRLNYHKEQEIYRVADSCMFSSELYNYVLTAFNVDKYKVFSFNYPLLSRLSSSNNKDYRGEICKIMFAGMVYREIRNPEFALWVLSNVNNIHLDLYINRGECEDIISRFLSPTIHRNQFVSREKYERMIRDEYDILLNIGNYNTLQAPSKMVELLSTGKPIINFYFTEDTQYKMIEKYPLGLNVKNQEEKAIEKIINFCSEMRGKRLPFREVEKLYPENNLQYQVNLLEKIINSN